MKETNKRERSSQKSQTNQTDRTEKSSTNRKSERSQKNQRSQGFEDCDRQLRHSLNEGKEEVENVGKPMIYCLFFRVALKNG